MICQFIFENYKSFRDEAMVDFFAENISENCDRLIADEKDNEKFLPVIALYGPNGGGKSTVLEAITFLKAFIRNKLIPLQTDSLDLSDHEEKEKFIKMLQEADFKEKYHKFDSECKNKPTKFEILFRNKGTEFKYILELMHNRIIEEHLYARRIGEKNASIVFERVNDDFYLGEALKEITVPKLKNTMPLIVYIVGNYDVGIVDEAVSWLLSMSVLDYDNPVKERQILFPEDKGHQNILFDMLREMDINIFGIRLEEDGEGNIKEVYTKHMLEDGSEQELLFEEESSGTRKLFSCMAEILDCLQQGKVLIADELDAKLHPKLLRYIISLFTSTKSNTTGAQLLLTSHDITTMNSEVFRRDEIYFCALNRNNASKLYPLVTFKKENGKSPRNDEAYGKQYMEGKYGADPYLRKILDWEKYNELKAAKSQ